MEGAPTSCSIGSSHRFNTADGASQSLPANGHVVLPQPERRRGVHKKALQAEFELGINACGQLEPKLGRQQVNAASGV